MEEIKSYMSKNPESEACNSNRITDQPVNTCRRDCRQSHRGTLSPIQVYKLYYTTALSCSHEFHTIQTKINEDVAVRQDLNPHTSISISTNNSRAKATPTTEASNTHLKLLLSWKRSMNHSEILASLLSMHFVTVYSQIFSRPKNLMTSRASDRIIGRRTTDRYSMHLLNAAHLRMC